MVKKISRKEAQEQGLIRYYTGEPCKYGHICERFTLSRQCVECGRANNLKRPKKPEKPKLPNKASITKQNKLQAKLDYEGYLKDCQDNNIEPHSLITRQQAKEQGLARYFTGKRCANGHISERFVCSSTCVDCPRDRYKAGSDAKKQKLIQEYYIYCETNKIEPLEIVTFKEAKEKGLQFYFDGKPCKNGHYNQKYVNGHRCTGCIKAANEKPEGYVDKRLRIRPLNPVSPPRKSQEIKELEIIDRKTAKAKGLKTYFTGVSCKRGHLAERYVRTTCCKTCILEQKKVSRAKNRDKNLQYSRDYRARNLDKCREWSRNWNRNNKDRMRIIGRRNYDNHRDERIEASAEYFKTKIQNDVYKKNYQIVHDLRYRLKGTTNGKYFDEVGYSVEELKVHLTSQFDDKMSWDNYGSYWVIEHKIPVQWFVENGTPQDMVDYGWSFENIQPLEKRANAAKGDKILPEFEPLLEKFKSLMGIS